MYISITIQTQASVICKFNYRGLLNTVQFLIQGRNPTIISNPGLKDMRIVIKAVEFLLVQKLEVH